MDTKSTAFSAAVPVPELLDEHNYAEWAIRVQTYLEGQDLWEDIINDNATITAAPSQKENDDEVAIKVRRRRNLMALHVIQTSCGQDAFSEIRNIRTAHAAWQTLKEKYDMGSIDKSYLQYEKLYSAVLYDNWTAAKEFLDSEPEAVRKAITDKGETALHIAVTAGHAHIVEELVEIQHRQVDQDCDGCTARMTKEDLAIEDGDGCTALMKALEYGRSKLAHYLYTRTPLKYLAETDKKGAMLLTRAIYSKNLGMHIDQSTRFTLETSLDINNDGRLVTMQSVPGGVLLRHLVSIYITVRKYLLVPAKSFVRNLLGIEQLCETKRIHVQSQELLNKMCEEIPKIFQTRQHKRERVYDAIHLAVKNGIFEFFLTTFSKVDSRDLENIAKKNLMNIFMLAAVLYRHSEIFSLLIQHGCHTGLMKNRVISFGARNDGNNDDNILHMTGIVKDSIRFNQSSNAALQIQRELQWFKAVEGIVEISI